MKLPKILPTGVTRALRQIRSFSWQHIERGSWVAAIVGLPLAIVAIYITLNPANAPKDANTEISSVPSENVGSNTRANARADVKLGTVIGSVTINNSLSPAGGQPALDSVSSVAPILSVVKLAAFDVNEKRTLFREDEGYSELAPNQRWFRLEDRTNLWNCIDSKNLSQARRSCKGFEKLNAVFDVTLVEESGDDSVVLSAIRVFVLPKSGFGVGGGDGIFPAIIPTSGRFSFDLPKVRSEDQPYDSKKLLAILKKPANPPLLIRKGIPARFDIEFKNHCDGSCDYYLQVEFILSSGKPIRTNIFVLQW